MENKNTKVQKATVSKVGISGQDAVKIAIDFYNTITQRREIPSVEEIELKGNFWYITLGVSNRPAGLLYGGPTYPKELKVIKVDSQTGEPVSMKIRE